MAVGTLLEYRSAAGNRLGTAGQTLKPGDAQAVAEARLLPFPISSCMFRRSVLQAVGGFDELVAKSFPGQVEDLDLLARVARTGQIK